MNWTELIVAKLASWFNMSDNPTPQEVHQEMENVQDLDTLRETIRANVMQENALQMQQLSEEAQNLQAQLTTTQSRVTALETELADARARVTELESIEGVHTKQKSTGEGSGGAQTEMPVWDTFKQKLGLS